MDKTHILLLERRQETWEGTIVSVTFIWSKYDNMLTLVLRGVFWEAYGCFILCAIFHCVNMWMKSRRQHHLIQYHSHSSPHPHHPPSLLICESSSSLLWQMTVMWQKVSLYGQAQDIGLQSLPVTGVQSHALPIELTAQTCGSHLSQEAFPSSQAPSWSSFTTRVLGLVFLPLLNCRPSLEVSFLPCSLSAPHLSNHTHSHHLSPHGRGCIPSPGPSLGHKSWLSSCILDTSVWMFLTLEICRNLTQPNFTASMGLHRGRRMAHTTRINTSCQQNVWVFPCHRQASYSLCLLQATAEDPWNIFQALPSFLWHPVVFSVLDILWLTLVSSETDIMYIYFFLFGTLRALLTWTPLIVANLQPWFFPVLLHSPFILRFWNLVEHFTALTQLLNHFQTASVSTSLPYSLCELLRAAFHFTNELSLPLCPIYCPSLHLQLSFPICSVFIIIQLFV